MTSDVIVCSADKRPPSVISLSYGFIANNVSFRFRQCKVIQANIQQFSWPTVAILMGPQTICLYIGLYRDANMLK